MTAHQRAAALRAEAEDAVRRTQVQLRAIDEVFADAESVLNERTALPVAAAA
ncbi:hypothetical protein [Amycolatopsis sp. NPDC001319]|uniref:hypothetical protein n=1 Tax=unclassified Amycolatopsis TaxID=2618356 RepID=UPI0036B3D55A